MAKTFTLLTRPAMRAVTPGGWIREHGIEFKRLSDGDGVFSVNIMVDGQRIHRVVGRESDGTTRSQAEELIERLRQDAKTGRLSLPKGRKVTLSFAEAATQYLDELARNGGKDVKEKRRRLSLHLVPFFGTTPLSRIDSPSIERYKEQRRNEPSRRGGIRRGKRAQHSQIANRAKLTTQATINRELAVLSHLLNCAVDWGWISSVPTKIRRFRESRTRLEYLTADEIKRMLEAAAADANPQIYPFIAIALTKRDAPWPGAVSAT